MIFEAMDFLFRRSSGKVPTVISFLPERHQMTGCRAETKAVGQVPYPDLLPF
jgi:hypothetical protein